MKLYVLCLLLFKERTPQVVMVAFWKIVKFALKDIVLHLQFLPSLIASIYLTKSLFILQVVDQTMGGCSLKLSLPSGRENISINRRGLSITSSCEEHRSRYITFSTMKIVFSFLRGITCQAWRFYHCHIFGMKHERHILHFVM